MLLTINQLDKLYKKIHLLCKMTEMQENIYFGIILLIMLGFGLKIWWDYREQEKLNQYSITDLDIQNVLAVRKIMDKANIQKH